MPWEPLFNDLASETTQIEVRDAVLALANSGLATDAELVLVKEAVEALASSGLATEAEQAALREYITDKCRSLQKYEKSCGETILHYVDETTCNRYHFRAPEGTAYGSPLWEVAVFDNVNGKISNLTEQKFTDHAPLPADASEADHLLEKGLYAFYTLGEGNDSNPASAGATAVDISGNDLHGTYLSGGTVRVGGETDPGGALNRVSSGLYRPLNGNSDTTTGIELPFNVAGWQGLTVMCWWWCPNNVAGPNNAHEYFVTNLDVIGPNPNGSIAMVASGSTNKIRSGTDPGDMESPFATSQYTRNHVVVTMDPTISVNSGQLIVNGQRMQYDNWTAGSWTFDNSKPLRIGARRTQETVWWEYHGYLSTVAVFNKALTLAEVDEIYQRQKL